MERTREFVVGGRQDNIGLARRLLDTGVTSRFLTKQVKPQHEKIRNWPVKW